MNPVVETNLSSLIVIAVLLLVSSLQGASAAAATRKPKSDQSNGQNCTNHLQMIDKCSSMATYSFTTPSNPYPVNSSDMKASCERIVEGLKCLKIHGKCLKPLARRSVSSYTTARSRHSKRLCANISDAKSVDFWKTYECIKTKNKSSIMFENEKELVGGLQMLAANTTMKWDDRLHKACCVASAHKTKVLNDIEPECAKFKPAAEDMLNSMIGELLDSACPESNKLAEICPKLPKLEVSKEWKAVSLSGAALDLIVSLSDNKD